MRLLFLSGLGVFLFSFSALGNQGLKLMRDADRINSGFGGELSEMQMTLINASGVRMVRKIRSKVKEIQSDGDQSIVTFLWPADVKGTKLLTWTHKKDNDSQWLFLPALKRVKRISSSNMTGSFMGSEFSYEDLGSQEVEKYTYKDLGKATVSGRPVSKIERIPTSPNSGYSRHIVYLDEGYQNPTKIEYFDRKDKLLKVSNLTDWKNLGKFWRFHEIKIDNVQTKKSSILKWTSRKLNQAFSDNEFVPGRLKR